MLMAWMLLVDPNISYFDIAIQHQHARNIKIPDLPRLTTITDEALYDTQIRPTKVRWISWYEVVFFFSLQ
jgi:hypothetical protein